MRGRKWQSIGPIKDYLKASWTPIVFPIDSHPPTPAPTLFPVDRSSCGDLKSRSPRLSSEPFVGPATPPTTCQAPAAPECAPPERLPARWCGTPRCTSPSPPAPQLRETRLETRRDGPPARFPRFCLRFLFRRHTGDGWITVNMQYTCSEIGLRKCRNLQRSGNHGQSG